MSQHAQILKILRKAGNKGVANHVFPGMRILDYTARISELRHDGHNVVAERQHLPNGRATNTFRYYLIEDQPKKRRFGWLR